MIQFNYQLIQIKHITRNISISFKSVFTSSLILREILPTYPSSACQLWTSLTTSSSGARGRCWAQRFTSLRSFKRGSFSSHRKYSDGFSADDTTYGKRTIYHLTWRFSLSPSRVCACVRRKLTVSSSCLAVVCSVTQKTAKGSGPGAPYTVTLCCWDARFSSELNIYDTYRAGRQ